MMGGRIKVITSFAFIGFVAGVIANMAYHTVIPALLNLFPEILAAEWALSGFAGALLTVLLVVVWAYVSRPTS